MPETIKQAAVSAPIFFHSAPCRCEKDKRAYIEQKEHYRKSVIIHALHVAIGIIAQPLFLRLYFSLSVCLTFWEKRDEQIDNSTYTQGI